MSAPFTPSDSASVAPEAATAPPVPFPDADLSFVVDLLSDDEKARYRTIRAFLQAEVRQQSIPLWNTESFAPDLVAKMAEYGLGELQVDGSSRLFKGLVYAEVARADVSLSALVGIHNELIVGMIDELGSEEQKAAWLPGLRNFTKTGAFALTEPLHGSDIAGGLSTTARREGDEWVISGQKRWIGMGTISDFALIWARDEEDAQIKAFIVESDRPGYSSEKICNKMGLRIMQNAHITLDEVRVPESNRLPGASSFKAANELLRDSRAWVGWQGVGIQLAAFDVARDYAMTRTQFGRQLAKFQLVQEPLARMIGNAQASLGLMVQLARVQSEGRLDMVQAAMGKSTTTRLARETVSIGRGILGGNGVTSDYEMAKIFGDAEILFTYEGTYEINSLIVARGVTGVSAFV